MSVKLDRQLDILAEPDVLVCGIGCAGVTAALAAARMGAKTLAVERWPFAGGNITAAHVPGCCGLADMTTGELAVGGIMLELLEQTGALQLPLPSTKLFEPHVDDETLARRHTKLPYFWNIEKFKLATDRLFPACGVDLLYHARVADVVKDADCIDAVVLATKDGLTAIRPSIVIDCTGDADVAAWAGAPCEIDEAPQPMTLEFYVGNVRGAEDKQALQDKCADVLSAAREHRRIGIYGGPWLSFPWPGTIRVNAIRLPFNAVSARELTRAEIQGREDAWKMFDLWKDALPEFADAQFTFSGPAAGARESRRIVGEYVLTKDDILATRPFHDAIVKGAWYLDRHPADAPGYHPHAFVKAYDIPYRTLLPRGVDNLLVAGRCHSATSQALASSRVGVTAMGMGQAAGVAAAMAAKDHTSPRGINVKALRCELARQGAVLSGMDA